MKHLGSLTLTAILVAASVTPVHAATASAGTIRNLNTAFQGEANAHVRYSRFAEIAESEGHPRAAMLFRAAAKSEATHRDTHRAAILKLGGTVDELVIEPVTEGATVENLRASLSGESYERDTMYPEFLNTARSENARAAVRSLQFALSAEKEHAKLYAQMLEQPDSASASGYYVCTVCGFTSPALPDGRCPSCRNPLEKFVLVD